jgi:hypothetical protein
LCSRIELGKLGGREGANRTGCIRCPVHGWIVKHDELVIAGQANVEFDGVNADFEGMGKSIERILGSFGKRSTMSNDQHVFSQSMSGANQGTYSFTDHPEAMWPEKIVLQIADAAAGCTNVHRCLPE